MSRPVFNELGPSLDMGVDPAPKLGESSTRTPVRIQRKRTRGWLMPEDAVYVGRPSRWGNPFRAGVAFMPFYPALTARLAVQMFRGLTTLGTYPDIAPLRGKDLACWCPLEDEHGKRVPCHADVLLELANR